MPAIPVPQSEKLQKANASRTPEQKAASQAKRIETNRRNRELKNSL